MELCTRRRKSSQIQASAGFDHMILLNASRNSSASTAQMRQCPKKRSPSQGQAYVKLHQKFCISFCSPLLSSPFLSIPFRSHPHNNQASGLIAFISDSTRIMKVTLHKFLVVSPVLGDMLLYNAPSVGEPSLVHRRTAKRTRCVSVL